MNPEPSSPRTIKRLWDEVVQNMKLPRTPVRMNKKRKTSASDDEVDSDESHSMPPLLTSPSRSFHVNPHLRLINWSGSLAIFETLKPDFINQHFY